jgi:hypothetical protein
MDQKHIDELIEAQNRAIEKVRESISEVLQSEQFKKGCQELKVACKKISDAFVQASIELNRKQSLNVPAMSGKYRHVKRGTEYTIDRMISVQTSGAPIQDGELLLVYESVRDKAGYGRRLDEFNDGRFVRVDLKEEEPELPFWPGDI